MLAAVTLWLSVRPLRRALRFLVTVAAGWAGLWLVNAAGSAVHFHLPLNPLTATVAAVTGIPGVLALAVLQRLWGHI